MPSSATTTPPSGTRRPSRSRNARAARGRGSAGLRAGERYGRDRQAVVAPGPPGRSLLLSQGRHARLHDAGVRAPGTRTASCRAKARSCSAFRRTVRSHTSSSRRSTSCRSRSSPIRITRSPSSTGSGPRRVRGPDVLGRSALDLRRRRRWEAEADHAQGQAGHARRRRARNASGLALAPRGRVRSPMLTAHQSTRSSSSASACSQARRRSGRGGDAPARSWRSCSRSRRP